MRSFEEYWNEHGDVYGMEIAENAWDYRQTEVDELQYKAKLRESDHQALLVKYQATKKCLEDMSKEKDELQKRVDQYGLIIANVMSIASDLQKSWEMFEIGKKLEQALKGGF